jgi:hypothetical protein
MHRKTQNAYLLLLSLAVFLPLAAFADGAAATPPAPTSPAPTAADADAPIDPSALEGLSDDQLKQLSDAINNGVNAKKTSTFTELLTKVKKSPAAAPQLMQTLKE